MGKFIKHVFAAMIGVLLALGVLLVIGLIIAGAALSSSQKNKVAEVKDGSLLYIQLGSDICEQDKSDDIAALTSLVSGTGKEPTIGLNVLTKAIKKAAESDKIKGIFIESSGNGHDYATLQVLHRTLADFKKSGKFIMSYADAYSQGDYYVCSLADKIVLNPCGDLTWKGLASRPMFFKNLLEKVGVKVQVFKVGTYKSAVEPYINTEMSPANREQMDSYMGSIWNNIVSEVSEARHMPIDTLQAYAERGIVLLPAEELVGNGMVDTLAYIDGTKMMLKQLCGIKKDDKLSLASPYAVAEMSTASDKSSSNKIAVYYASGDIVSEIPRSMGMAQEYICGMDVVEDIEKLADDDAVKAVVLRLNSPGGDSYASEQLWHALKELGKKKPLVVSMSNYAASGGYYMAVAGERIFAEPTTLTGSIGIFGLIPDASELLTNKLGITFDIAKTNKNSDFAFGDFTHPISAENAEKVQSYVNRGYQLFMSRVSEGRNMTMEHVDSIGQGRVWTGEQALELGLVDELGGLDEAIAYAAKQAKIEKDYEVEEGPEPEPWYMDLLNEAGNNYFEQKMHSLTGDVYEAYRMLQLMRVQGNVQARIPYNPNIY